MIEKPKKNGGSLYFHFGIVGTSPFGAIYGEFPFGEVMSKWELKETLTQSPFDFP